MTAMTMPEAPVHENYCIIFRQGQIGFAWEIIPVQAETKSVAMNQRSNPDFGRGVLCPDSRHHATAGSLVDDIDHLPAG